MVTKADRQYFTRQDARLLVGRRVQARVAISWASTRAPAKPAGSEAALRNLGLLGTAPAKAGVTASSQGRVVQIASGPGPYAYLVGVRGDDPRPAAPAGLQPALVRAPRHAGYPIDWYTEDEFRDLLKAVPAKAGIEKARHMDVACLAP